MPMIGITTPDIKAPRAKPGKGPHPSGKRMREWEADAEERLARALNKLRLDVTRGMTEESAPYITTRLVMRDVIQPFTDAVIAVLRDIALDGADFGKGQIERYVFGIRKDFFGINWDLINYAAEQWARQYGAALVRGITDTTRDRIRGEVAQWATNKESISQLAQRLAEPSGPFGLKRAKTIAVTETTRAFAEGNRAAWKESKVVERQRWNTANDELVCPICGPLHNKVIGINETFSTGGPPAHPNCRCWITPVVEGAEELEVGL